MAIIGRGGLAIPRAVYTFVDRGFVRPRAVWASVAFELETMAVVLPLVGAELSALWGPTVEMVDAAPRG
eukprot:14584269-Alexandrium_andersonii.AAC.1